MRQSIRRCAAVALAAGVLVLSGGRWAQAACSGGPEVFACLSEADYLAKVAALGFATFQEGFEDDAVWGTVRSTLAVPKSAPGITSQGIVWTANRHQDNIATGTGARRTGAWGLYDPRHGFATGSSLECDIDNPPNHCLWFDGFTGTRVPGAGRLYGAAGYIKGTYGANVVVVLDDVIQVGLAKQATTAHKFMGVIDTRGFNRFQFKEIDGKIGQKFLIFGDDFTFAVSL